MDEVIRTILDKLYQFLRPETDPRQMQKRQRVLAAATELFITHGYRKTTVEDVARRAGIAKGTVYLYYRNKAELLFHAVALEKERYLTELGSLSELPLSPLDRLRGLVAVGLIMSRRMPLMQALTQGDCEIELALRECDASLLRYLSEHQISMIARLIDEASEHRWPDAELAERAGVLADLMFALTTSGRVEGADADLERRARLLADIMVTGVIGADHAMNRWARGTVDAVRAAAAGRQGQP